MLIMYCRMFLSPVNPLLCYCNKNRKINIISFFRKRVRRDIGKLFPDLTPEYLLQIIPAKEDMTIAKIYTHSGDSLILYCVQRNPVFIEAFKELIPTVYTMWNFPDLLPVFRTWPPVFSKLKGGAGNWLYTVSDASCFSRYSETCVNQTVNKKESCINRTSNKFPGHF